MCGKNKKNQLFKSIKKKTLIGINEKIAVIKHKNCKNEKKKR